MGHVAWNKHDDDDDDDDDDDQPPSHRLNVLLNNITFFMIFAVFHV